MSDTRVYFVRSARSRAVKIGVADNPCQRLSSMQTGSIARLHLLAEMPGDERYERVLHAAFAEYRIRGEWFRLEGRLAAFVSMLPAMYALESRRHRVREKSQPKAPDPRVSEYWQKVMLPAVRDAVLAFGVERFCKIAGRRPAFIVRAIYDRGNHFAMKDFVTLYASVDEQTAAHLLNLMARPFGFAVLTPAELEKRKQDRERLQRIRDEVIEVLGVDEGRAWLDKFDRDIAEENARRRAAFEADPYAFH